MSKLICILAIVSNAFAVEGWLNYSNPFPIKSAVPYGDGLLMATDGGIRYRTNTADDMYTTSNGLGDQSMSAVVISDLGTFAVGDNGIITTMVNGYWQVASRSYVSSKMHVIPDMVRLSGHVLTIAFENSLSFFSLKTLTSILTIERISDKNLSLNPISAMNVRGDSLFVAIDNSLYVRKMDWENLESDVQLYDQNSWSRVNLATEQDKPIKDIVWKDGKIKTFSTEGTRLWDKDGETLVTADTFATISSESPLVVIRGKTLKDSILYEKNTIEEIHGKDTIVKYYYKSKARWISLLPSNKAVLAGPQSIFYYDGKKISDLTEFKRFAIGGAYELQVLPEGGVLAASVEGKFSRNLGYEWSAPKEALFGHGNKSDASGHDIKALSVIPGGRTFYHIWGLGYFMYSRWGESLDNAFMSTDGFCMDNFFDDVNGPSYTVALSTVPAPNNMGFLTTSGSNKGYSLIYVDLKGNISCANNIGSSTLAGPMVVRVEDDKWVVYVGTRKEMSLDAGGGLDVISFPPPSKTGGELDVSKTNVKTYYGTTTTPLDMIYEPNTGYFWFVTISSLAYWNQEQDSLRTPLSTNGLTGANFTSIDADSRGNLWVGTSANGVYRLTPRPTNPDTLSVVHFTTHHGLLSNRVQDVAVDSLLGFVWFAHENGITRYTRNDLRSTSGNMTDNAREDVKVFPNPFRPRLQPYVLFNNIAEDAVINIYNRGGKLVVTLSGEQVVGGRAEWNGRTDNGNLVAPGVYQYVIRGASKVKKGKLLVIH